MRQRIAELLRGLRFFRNFSGSVMDIFCETVCALCERDQNLSIEAAAAKVLDLWDGVLDGVKHGT